MMIERNILIYHAVSQLGKPYLFGAKWGLKDIDPKGPTDCSGFVRWCYAQIGLDIPDGSTNQKAAAISIMPSILILPGDLVFLHTPLGPDDEHHVGMVYDKYLIIEARGIIVDGKEIGKVELHSRREWEGRADFTGYFRPKVVTAIEGAI
jgi:cell wall-associated NlpC family hydrolase